MFIAADYIYHKNEISNGLFSNKFFPFQNTEYVLSREVHFQDCISQKTMFSNNICFYKGFASYWTAFSNGLFFSWNVFLRDVMFLVDFPMDVLVAFQKNGLPQWKPCPSELQCLQTDENKFSRSNFPHKYIAFCTFSSTPPSITRARSLAYFSKD